MVEAQTTHGHQGKVIYCQHGPCTYNINRVVIYWELLVEFSCDFYLISALRFIVCITIGLLTSGCHNTLPRRMFPESSTPLIMMHSTLSRRHSPLLLSLLIGFPILNSLWKLIFQTMLLLQSFSFLINKMKFIQLLFTSALLLWQS